MFFKPMQHKNAGLSHNPLKAIVSPRPIGWIASKGADDSLNLAPYSFFNAFNYTPPIIGFASIGAKDTVGDRNTILGITNTIIADTLAIR